MTIGDVKLDLGKVKVPIYNLATREDHIAPAKSAFLGSKFFGGPVRFVLSGSGHIAGVVNPPEQGEIPVLDRRQGRRRLARSLAEEGRRSIPAPGGRTGSQWIKSQDADEVPARKPGGGKLTPIEDAPGQLCEGAQLRLDFPQRRHARRWPQGEVCDGDGRQVFTTRIFGALARAWRRRERSPRHRKHGQALPRRRSSTFTTTTWARPGR